MRDKLRVLLVSGEPHAGERTWRNLLKSDASVDLVHFTILRPPEKQDGTPINELSLIAFPTRELFQQKIGEFQLIIFDRYARQGVLPLIYFDNIARYVKNGGAVLIAAGPDYAGATSIWRTPLDRHPAGRAERQGDRAAVPCPADRTRQATPGDARPSRRGKRPARIGAAGSGSSTPTRPKAPLSSKAPTTSRCWSWDARAKAGSRFSSPTISGCGRAATRVAARILIFSAGSAHWLMKQPDLEEEALRMSVRGREITVRRQSMADTVEPVTMTTPSGKTEILSLTTAGPGVWTGKLRASELGLWRATDGKLTALINVGPANPREFSEVTSSTEMIAPIATATGGSARRIDDNGTLRVPRVIAVRSSDAFAGSDWIGLKIRDVSVVRGIGVLPVFAGLLGLLLLIGSLAATWAREGR